MIVVMSDCDSMSDNEFIEMEQTLANNMINQIESAYDIFFPKFAVSKHFNYDDVREYAVPNIQKCVGNNMKLALVLNWSGEMVIVSWVLPYNHWYHNCVMYYNNQHILLNTNFTGFSQSENCWFSILGFTVNDDGSFNVFDPWRKVFEYSEKNDKACGNCGKLLVYDMNLINQIHSMRDSMFIIPFILIIVTILTNIFFDDVMFFNKFCIVFLITCFFTFIHSLFNNYCDNTEYCKIARNMR